MSKTACRTVAIVALLAAGPAQAGERPDVPVMIGGDPELDACASVGRVAGLDPNGANLLSVRSGPGVSYRRLDVIAAEQVVFVCGAAGHWLSIVYTRADTDCGVSSPVPHRREYDGPCAHGWVFDRYVTLVAG